MKYRPSLAVPLLMLCLLTATFPFATPALAQQHLAHAPSPGATSRPSSHPASDDLLYDDPTGLSTATIAQVFGTSTTPLNTTINGVRRIRIKNDVLIIEWGDTAITLLPRQFVASIALNRRTPPAPIAR